MADIFYIKARERSAVNAVAPSNQNASERAMTDFDISQFPEYRQIPLNKGYHAIVDVENYDWLMQFKWFALVTTHHVYAIRHSPMVRTIRGPMVLMHRQIMATPPDMETDHQDRNGLFNTWENLRVCTKTQNMCNTHLKKSGASKFRGVVWHKRNQFWQAQIKVSSKCLYLGNFADEIEAARAYNAAAAQYHGEFARLNVIEEAA